MRKIVMAVNMRRWTVKTWMWKHEWKTWMWEDELWKPECENLNVKTWMWKHECEKMNCENLNVSRVPPSPPPPPRKLNGCWEEDVQTSKERQAWELKYQEQVQGNDIVLLGNQVDVGASVTKLANYTCHHSVMTQRQRALMAVEEKWIPALQSRLAAFCENTPPDKIQMLSMLVVLGLIKGRANNTEGVPYRAVLHNNIMVFHAGLPHFGQ